MRLLAVTLDYAYKYLSLLFKVSDSAEFSLDTFLTKKVLVCLG
jgi:hypothetical protein